MKSSQKNDTVAYRPLAEQWLCKEQALLGNARQQPRNDENAVFYAVRAEML
jgi:hypothetical protein